MDADSDKVRRIEPDQDIDEIHEADKLRIERMSEDTLWFAGYRDAEDEGDIHFMAECGDSGLVVKSYR